MGRIRAYFMRTESNIVYQGYIASLEDSVKAFEEYVGGKIRVTDLENGMAVISILQDGSETPNRALALDDEIITVFFGNILAVRYDGNNFLDIHKNDVQYLESILKPIAGIEGYTIKISDGALVSYRTGED